jgi:hypothetical protein
MDLPRRVIVSDRIIEGWKNISAMFNWSIPTVLKRRAELCDAGVVFYMRRGRPPRMKACAWESCIKIWMMKKGSKGETL